MNTKFAVGQLVRAVCLAAMLAPSIAMAQSKIDVTDAWARASVPGQKVGAIYMELHSTAFARLLSASSPVAAKVEIHNMKMENNVMKMFPVEAIDLPAGQTVKLAPGATTSCCLI